MPPSTMRSATTAHCTRSPRYFGMITPRLIGADLVAGAADALQPGGHRRRRLDLDDEVDGAHVDAELEAGRRDDGGQAARLERLLDLRALLARDRAVVGAGDLDDAVAVGGGAVAPAGLARPPTPPWPGWAAGPRAKEAPKGLTPDEPVRPVDVERAPARARGCRSGRSVAISLSRLVSRSAVRRLLLNTMVERCCSTRSTMRSSTAGQIDARGSAPAADPPRTGPVDSPRAAMSSTGTTTCTSMVLAARRLHDDDLARAAEEARDLVDRAHRRRQADPLRGRARAARRAARGVSARWAPRLVPDTACTSSTMTVSTPRSDSRAAEVSTRNSDSGVVMKTSGGTLLKRRRSSAGVSPERMPTAMSGTGRSSRCDGLPDAGQRRAQVALDVDGERLERADVEHAAAVPGLLRDGRRGQPVERPQERRQRLAAAGRRDDEGVAAGGDGVPGALLGGRRRLEGAREPGPRRGGEAVERGHRSILVPAGDAARSAVLAQPRPHVGALRVDLQPLAPRPLDRGAGELRRRSRGPRSGGGTIVWVMATVLALALVGEVGGRALHLAPRSGSGRAGASRRRPCTAASPRARPPLPPRAPAGGRQVRSRRSVSLAPTTDRTTA